MPYSLYDHAPSRSWRHLNTCEYQTYIHAKIPRVYCEDHGMLQAKLPWCDKKSSFTQMMEGYILDALIYCENITGATRICNISWDQAFLIMQRGVERGMLRRGMTSTTMIAIDEKAFKKGHKYLTIISDLEKGIVLHIEEDRKKASLDSFYNTLEPEQKNNIIGVSMDMWPAYINSTIEQIDPKKEKIVFDRFHISAMLGEAVDDVRKEEHRKLLDEDNCVLTGTKYMWLYSQENLPEKYIDDYNKLTTSNLETARAWSFKEEFRHFFDYKSKGWAEKFFESWYSRAMKSKLKSIINVAKTLQNHLYGLLNYAKLQISNGIAEGLNSKIMAIKRRARGHRNIENLKTAIFFYCGNLSVYP